MAPIMLWSAEFSVALSEPEDANLIKIEKEWFYLPLKDKNLLSELPTSVQKLYKSANGAEIRWQLIKDSSQGGRINFIEAENVLRDGLGQTYYEEDLAEEELIKYFKPLDLITDEAECGFLHKSGFESEAIYYHKVGQPQLYNLDIDFDGYLEMIIAARAFYYWPKVLLDIQSGEESPETRNFKQNMPLIFEDFSWNDFVAKYQALRLSTKA